MAKGKMKMLHLIRIFCQETDDEHALTLQEIIAKPAAVNSTADRKTLYNDFEDLRQFGFDIIAQQRDRTTYYHLGEQDFELPELKLLVDSVQAAKFITTRKSRELIRKLERYTSVYQAAQLHRQVYIAGRVKAMNESIYYNIDRLHNAINALDEPRKGQKAFEAFDMVLYSKSVFGIFTGEDTTVTLEAENHMVGVIIDRFGKDINLRPVSEQYNNE